MRGSFVTAPGWKWSKVKHTAEFHTGWTPPTGDAESFEGDNLWANISDLGPKGLADTRKRISDAAVHKSAIKLSPAGSVLFSFKLSIGQVSFAMQDMYTNEAIATFPPQPTFNSRWAYYAFPVFVPENANENIYGAKLLNQELIRSADLLIPPPAEQERIANFLDERTAQIDALIAEKCRLESSLKDIEEVTAFDLVVRGTKVDVARQSFREPWLSDVPAHWELSKLRHIATVGNGSTPKRDNAAYWDGGTLPWLNSGSVNASRISEASDYVTANAKKECHLPVVRPGSTVVALTGQGKTRGSASIVEFETTLNQHLAYISLFDERRMSDEYLCVVLTGMYSVLRYISDDAGSTKGALTCEQLNQFRVPIPPAEEQVAIVDAYSARTKAINELRAHAKLHIDRLREYRSSLISAAVTGQLDINSYKEAA